jgi:hypothetical protein
MPREVAEQTPELCRGVGCVQPLECVVAPNACKKSSVSTVFCGNSSVPRPSSSKKRLETLTIDVFEARGQVTLSRRSAIAGHKLNERAENGAAHVPLNQRVGFR